ncbi:DegT/DnrJ/EryC1/StrS family aminotransferase [Winogradskyella sp. 3972H.M.0a.05]|uniref:DegT/DnrJ/EryC1/StrS family aminotransferase n=1 Tax=Winogradskyella sp. 3972H.M.0a.05 TaxID=2950277 RepID=UPI0033984515
MIPVTKSFIPPIEEYNSWLEKVWDSGWLTNRGSLVKLLEDKINAYLDTDFVIAMTNGTLPIQIAIKALDVKGDVITTPFSYVATTSTIFWEGCNPIFVDIDPNYFTIDETKIEAAITEETTAILATHVYGNPCNVEAIEAIAEKHNLSVIYDAAHCFGVKYKGQSLFDYGDVSTSSFHATKLFHTGEGGALFCKPHLRDKMYFHHNFGHKGQEAFHGLGINAKMSEIQAAMGLSVMPYLDEIIEKRKTITSLYSELLADASLTLISIREGTQWNYSYFPVVFESEAQLTRVKDALNKNEIYPRRYFFPSLNKLPYIKESFNCPVSESIASRVLCLPLYTQLSKAEVETICSIINETI